MHFRLIVIAACSALVLGACGGDEPSIGADARETEVDSEVTAASTTVAPTTSAPVASTDVTTTAAVASTTPAGSTAPPAAGATGQPTAPPATTVAPATSAATTAPPPPPVATGKACIVSLHGKGAGGQAEWTGDGVRHSFPGGNAAGWGGLQWLYYPESGYQSARAIVANDIANGGCGRVIVYGFSNGAAFAAKLYCRGETFGGRIVGYIIDDPVVDHAVEGCARPGVRVVLYWTGGIDQPDGWNCGDWTCEGGSTIGIARYEAAIGVVRKPSIYTTHRQYSDPPEMQNWF